MGRGGAEGSPAILLALHPAVAMLPGGFLTLLADHEGLGDREGHSGAERFGLWITIA